MALSRSRASRRARHSIALFVSLVAVCTTSKGALAGPWLPAPGRVYVELREQFSSTAQGFDSNGGRRRLHTLTDDGLPVPTRLYEARSRVYSEIGLATRLALVADLTLLDTISTPRAGRAARAATGVGDLSTGLRVQLLDEEVACSLSVTLGIPTGRSDEAQPLGSGDLRGEVVLSFGKIWERTPVFFAAELGARLRSSGTQRTLAAGLAPVDALGAPADARSTINYASELLYAVELGYLWSLGERLRLTPRVMLEGRHGLSAPLPLTIDPVAPTSMRFVRIGAALGFGVPLGSRRDARQAEKVKARLEVQVGGGAFVWGQGLPAAGELAIALGLSR